MAENNEGRDFIKRPMTPEEEEDHWFEIHCMQMVSQMLKSDEAALRAREVQGR